MGHDLLSALVDLWTWLQREFVSYGSVRVFGTFGTNVVYVLGLLSLPFAAWRQGRAGYWVLSLLLVGLWLYFLHNRLTLFSTVQLTRASLFGNVMLLFLGIYYIVPALHFRKRRNDGSTWGSD